MRWRNSVKEWKRGLEAMTTSDPNRLFEEYLSGQSKLSRIYRRAPADEPPPHLDHALLDAARTASRPRFAGSPFASHWYVPASLAAVLVLIVGIYMFSGERGAGPGPVPEAVPQAGKIAALPRAERAGRAIAEKKEEVAPGGLADAPAAPPVGAAFSEERKARRTASAEQSKAVAPSAAARDAGVAEAAKRKESHALAAAGIAVADVISVKASGASGAYYFDVGVRSTETGCRQYADWWEVVSEEGRLLYRRVLLHSHVDEQPFVRGGGPVAIQPSTVVWVRAHMNAGGYGGVAFKGSPQSGFQAAPLPRDFAAGLATAPPLPDGCAF